MPVNVFKELELKSSENIIKILTSSGTSGKASKIFLDKETAHTQTKVLAKILQDFIGKKRLPMLIIDTKVNYKKDMVDKLELDRIAFDLRDRITILENKITS